LRDIQTRAIHVIRDSQADVIVAASTAGKTEAAFLPLISEVLEEEPTEVEVLIYSTSRRSRR
jgi:ATP-dependent Lhr-like helicase